MRSTRITACVPFAVALAASSAAAFSRPAAPQPRVEAALPRIEARSAAEGANGKNVPAQVPVPAFLAALNPAGLPTGLGAAPALGKIALPFGSVDMSAPKAADSARPGSEAAQEPMPRSSDPHRRGFDDETGGAGVFARLPRGPRPRPTSAALNIPINRAMLRRLRRKSQLDVLFDGSREQAEELAPALR